MVDLDNIDDARAAYKASMVQYLMNPQPVLARRVDQTREVYFRLLDGRQPRELTYAA